MKNIILFLLTIISVTCNAQVAGNFKQVRLLNNTDSVTLGTTTGIVRYDPITGKYRFLNALTGTWFSYGTASGDFWKANDNTVLTNTAITVGPNSDNSHSLTIGRSGSDKLQLMELIGYDVSIASDNNTTISGPIRVPNFTDGFLQVDGDGNVSSGTIPAPTLTATRVGYGSAGNTLTGEAPFTYDAANDLLTVPFLATESITGATGISITATSGDVAIGGNNDLTISVSNNAAISANGGTLLLQSGSNDVNIVSPTGFESFVNSGPSSTTIAQTPTTITLTTPGGTSISSGGTALTFSTGSTSRLSIGSNGAWTINGSSGTSGQALVSNGSGGTPTWQSISSSPAGSNKQIQINNSGAFGAEAGFEYDLATDIFTVPYIEASTLKLNSTTAGRVIIADATNQILDDPELLYNATTNLLSAGNVTVSTNLTLSSISSGRALYTTTSGLVTSESNFTYDAATNSVAVNNGSGTSTRLVGNSVLGGVEVTNGVLTTTFSVTGHSITGSSSGGVYSFTSDASNSGFSFDSISGVLKFVLSGLPTSSAGLGSGEVWSNAGVLTIVP